MFYKSQIKSVGAGYAVDTSGKKLTFIGNYPCKPGDFVWTDGNFIFGNISPKPQPVIFDEAKSGIPVLTNQLRGYFNPQGVFKKYAIACDGNFEDEDGLGGLGSVFSSSFIVNNEKYYKYGVNSFEDGYNIVADVEISENGELLAALYEVGDRPGMYTAVNIFRDSFFVKRINAEDYINKVAGTEGYFVTIKGFKLFPNLEWTMVLAAQFEGETEIPDACPEL